MALPLWSLAGLLALSFSVLAQPLPDEIDIVTYKQRYQTQKAQSDQRRSEANQLLSRLQWREAQITTLEQEISNNYQQQQSSRARQSELESANQNLDSDIRQWQYQSSQYRQQQQSLQYRLQDLQRSYNALQNDERNMRNQFNQVQSQYNNALARANQDRNQVEGLQRHVGQLKTQVVNQQNRMRQNQQEIQNAHQRLRQAQPQLDQANQMINNMQAQLQNQRAQMDQAQDRLRALQAQQPRNENEINQQQQLIGQLKSAVVRSEQQLNQARSNQQQALSQVEQAKRQIAENEREQGQLQAQLNRDEQQLARTQQDLQVATQNWQISDREQNRLLAQLQGLETQVARMVNELQLLDRDVRQTSNELQTVNNYIAQVESYINNASQQMANNRSEVLRLNNTIYDLQRAAQAAEQKLTDHQRELPGDQNRYDQSEQVAQAAEAVTESARQAYNKRQALYDRYLAEARATATEQASPIGRERGSELGGSEGAKVGQNVGLGIGEQIAYIDGFLRGLVRGELSGHDVGYADGKADQVSYNEGYQQGIPMGQQKAETEARQTIYPQSYRAQMAQLLSAQPSQSVELDNLSLGFGPSSVVAASRNAHMIEAQPVSVTTKSLLEKELPADATEGETEISEEEWARADSIKSSVDNEIRQTRMRLDGFRSPDRSLSNPALSYKAPTQVKVDVRDQNCNLVYKQVAAYIQACKAQYDLSFTQAFLSQHEMSFNESFAPNYQQYRQENFELHKNDRFAAGKQAAYTPVYAEYRAIGAREIRQAGVDAGISDGYRDHIVPARNIMTQKGKDDANRFVQNNGVARLRPRMSGKLVTTHPEGLVQGAEVTVSIPMQNVAKQATRQGTVLVTMTAMTKNLQVINPKVALRSLPADSGVTLINVGQLKIDDYARGQEPLKLKLEFAYPGDDVETQYQETLIIEDVTKEINPKVQLGLNYKGTVQAQNRGQFTTHDIDVNLKALNANVPQGYTISVKPLVGAEYVRFARAEFTTPVMGKGESRTEKLSYTFVKDSNTQVLYFKIIVSYQGKEISSEKATIYMR